VADQHSTLGSALVLETGECQLSFGLQFLVLRQYQLGCRHQELQSLVVEQSSFLLDVDSSMARV
jgi:hypothetical protein